MRGEWDLHVLAPGPAGGGGQWREAREWGEEPGAGGGDGSGLAAKDWDTMGLGSSLSLPHKGAAHGI